MIKQLISLDSALRSWNPAADANKEALGTGWDVSERMANLHVHALQRISKAAGTRPERVDEACLLLGAHCLNLYLSAIGLIIRGQFDVAPHLLRALFDCESLGFGAGSRKDLADRFFADDLGAGECRELAIEMIRPVDPQLADDMNCLYLDEYKAANQLSHVGLIHLEKLVDRSDNSITPVLGGFADAMHAVNLTKAANQHEHSQLVWFKAFRRADVLGEDWIHEYDEVGRLHHEWMKSAEP